MSEETFDFGSTEDGSIVLRTRRGVAVYRNGDGDVVIRQDGWPDEDSIIIVPACDAEMLAEAIRSEARDA